MAAKKTAYFTAAAGRKNLRRIQACEEAVRALQRALRALQEEN